MKKSTMVGIGGGVIGVGLLASSLFSGEFGVQVDQLYDVTVPQQEITQYKAELPQCVGELATFTTVRLDAKGGVHASIPFTNLHPGISWKDKYSGQLPGSFEFCMKSSADISTTRKDVHARPLASDTVDIHLDRSSLFVDRPRIDASKDPTHFVVKDSHIVKRDGQPVNPPEPIFAANGNYSTGAFHVDGDKKGYLSRFTQKLSFDNVNIGQDAATDILAIGQVETRNPGCITKAWRVVSPDQLAIEAFRNGYMAKGFSENNIHVDFSGEWPTPDKLPDERGQTYAQSQHQLTHALSHVAEQYSVAQRCDASAVANPHLSFKK